MELCFVTVGFNHNLRYCIHPDFAEKSLHKAFEYLHENGLINSFDEVYKLCQVILTISSHTASAERSFSALKLILTGRRQGQERMSSLSLLSIERRVLLQLQQKWCFYDDLSEKFIAQKRRIELCYR